MPRATRTAKRGRPKQSHCKYGHARTPENVDNIGRCRTCRAIDWRAWKQRQREHAIATRAEEAKQALLAADPSVLANG